MNIRRFLYLIMTAVVLTAAVLSCEKKEDDSDIILGGNSGSGNTSGGIDVTPPVDLTGYASRIEVPALKSGNLFIQHSTQEKQGWVMNYCLEYDTEANHSYWVAFRFDALTSAKTVGRSGDFAEDPDLPSKYYHGSNGFGSGYDRGHLCASADRLHSLSANYQTFYMTNMSPQMSRFNQDYWVGFEGKVQTWGRDRAFCDTLYVVKGGTIADGQTLGTLTRNGKKVVIPKYYYMALLKCKNNTYSAMAFWMEHKNYNIVFDNLRSDEKKREFESKAVSIDRLEELTGIDFFHNLPDVIEEQVESQLVLSAWGL